MDKRQYTDCKTGGEYRRLLAKGWTPDPGIRWRVLSPHSVKTLVSMLEDAGYSYNTVTGHVRFYDSEDRNVLHYSSNKWIVSLSKNIFEFSTHRGFAQALQALLTRNQ
jgi:hypothetical protein